MKRILLGIIQKDDTGSAPTETLPLGLKDERKLSQSGTEEDYWALWKPLSPLIGPITTSRDPIRARKRRRQSRDKMSDGDRKIHRTLPERFRTLKSLGEETRVRVRRKMANRSAPFLNPSPSKSGQTTPSNIKYIFPSIGFCLLLFELRLLISI